VENAIGSAESVASDTAGREAAAIDAVRAALGAGNTALVAHGANAAVNAAVNAANAAANAARDVAHFPKIVSVDAASAADAAMLAGISGGHDIEAAIKRDFQLLREAATSLGWTDKQTVAKKFFGPLWPDGPPVGWPNAEVAGGVAIGGSAPVESVSPAVIALVWDPSVVSADEYAELVDALADLVRAEGGQGLRRLDSRQFGVPSRVGVPQ
jgi:hypothetical protein